MATKQKQSNNELVLGKKTAYNHSQHRSQFVLDDKIQFWFNDSSMVVGYFIELDHDDDPLISIHDHDFFCLKRNITHIKLIERALESKEAIVCGVELKIQGSKLWIRGEIVNLEFIWALGHLIGALEYGDGDRRTHDDLITLMQANARRVLFFDDYSIKCGCVHLLHDEAIEVIHWIWDNVEG